MAKELTSSFWTQVQELTPRHYKILDLAICGNKKSEIAKTLNMSVTQIGIIMNSPCFKHQYGLRRAMHEEKVSEQAAIELDKTRATLQNATILAADTLVGGLSSVDEKIKIKAASEILDRSGYPKETKLEGGSQTTIVIDSKNLNIMKETLEMVKNEPEVDLFKITGS